MYLLQMLPGFKMSFKKQLIAHKAILMHYSATKTTIILKILAFYGSLTRAINFTQMNMEPSLARKVNQLTKKQAGKLKCFFTIFTELTSSSFISKISE
jgi:hypothetical protein